MMSSSSKPATARHLKDATRNNNLDRTVLKQLRDKAMEPKYTTKLDGYDCVFSTRTGSQDMPQLKLEMKEGNKIQILCTHAVALYEGKKAVHWFDDLSHLCGIRQYVVHTVWELPWDNVSRDGCHKYNFFEACPHQPPCVPEPPYHLVKAAIEQKQKGEEAVVAADKKKAKKRLQNANAYAKKKKQKLEQEKQKGRTTDEVVEKDSGEERCDENTSPNITGISSSSREHIIIE
jgi:TusA-related sulfurtransferase